MRDWRRDTSPPVLHPLKGRRHLQCFCRCVRSTNTLALKELMPARNIIEVGFEIGLDADEYDDIYSSLGEMPKRAAEAFPDFNFYCIEQTDAYGVAANSEATMKHGEFVCVSGDSDGNFGKRVIGHIIDGNIVFTEENIDMDEVMQILFEEE